MIELILKVIFGDKTKRDLKKIQPVVRKINELESWAQGLNDAEFPAITQTFKQRHQEGESLDALLPEVFALAREAALRVLGERPYDVQLMGSIALHRGNIAEMKTGEGKTLTSVAPAYLNALAGKGVHIVTVNDYLAERDAKQMGKVHNFLGLEVGVILSSMDVPQRQKEYQKDITYITNNELGFDYLRDNMCWSLSKKSQRKHFYCIIDEIDSILIDEARTPLIISGVTDEDVSKYKAANKIVQHLRECEKDKTTGDYPKFDPFSNEQPDGDYMLNEKNKHINFTNEGINSIERSLQNYKIIHGSLYDGDNFEMLHYVTQALKAHYLFHCDVDYVKQDKKVEIVDEHTGRVLSGRRYSDGLHQAIEAKENIKIAQRSRTVATITFQNFFLMYDKVSGMTGTAATEAKEFSKIYNLDVIEIPTNEPIARVDDNDIIYLTEAQKVKVIAQRVKELQIKGQPVLVGTISVEKSEKLSHALNKIGVPHEILNAKNHHREAHIIEQAGAKGSVTIATNMAGRGTDIKLGGNYLGEYDRLITEEMSEEEKQKLEASLKAKWQQANREVIDLGGLYVIGTERHESRRIDNQLRGRSGRQGDPGYTQFFVSLDDDLMRLFGGANLKRNMMRFGMKEEDELQSRIVSKRLEGAQQKVETRNYEIRKHLLDYDDVLNKQRSYIYQMRNDILANENILSEIQDIGQEFVDVLFQDYQNDRRSLSEKDSTAKLFTRLQSNFAYLDKNQGIQKPSSMEALEESVREWLKQDLEMKADIISPKEFNDFIRYEYIRLIDSSWQDHLEGLEALREAVSLRSYAQKNPLVEYKNEGFEIFENMREDLRVNIGKRIFKIHIAPETLQRTHVNTSLANATTKHENVSGITNFNQSRSPKPTQDGSKIEKVQIKHDTPKTGRNDPCPCGSGKKYKRCHGS